MAFGPKQLKFKKDQIDKITLFESERFGLELNQNPINLSPENLRKLTIASILAIDPDIIIFDEPTNTLDENEIIKLNSKGLYLKDVDHEISSPDVIDQAASQTEKNVEMRTINRQIKLLSKIEKAIKKINDNTYGYCEETGEAIGLKRLIARPIATLSIESQEKHEKNEKIFAN